MSLSFCNCLALEHNWPCIAYIGSSPRLGQDWEPERTINIQDYRDRDRDSAPDGDESSLPLDQIIIFRADETRLG